MKVVIIEDEKPAAEKLERLLNKTDSKIEVVKKLESRISIMNTKDIDTKSTISQNFSSLFFSIFLGGSILTSKSDSEENINIIFKLIMIAAGEINIIRFVSIIPRLFRSSRFCMTDMTACDPKMKAMHAIRKSL